MMDEVDIFDVTCDRVIEEFKIEKLKAVKRESLKKLVNMQDVFAIQTTEWRKSLVF